MKRREFITLSAKSLGGLLIYTLAREPMFLNAQEGTIKVPLRFFTAAEARTVAAACERILPSDDSGPGAKEAGVIIYIDHQLAGPYGKDKYRYTKGPWVESDPEHGYQGQANPQQIYREGIKTLGDGFADLSAAQQDEKLRSIESTYFFRMLRTHTIEGMFSDPMHGGNANLIGWQLIGYPGPLMSYRNEIGKFNGVAWRRKPMSLEQVLRRPVKGWEDEAS
jgi:gluconate 2-dehydrogenase gamma chain